MPKKPVRWGIKIWCLCDSLKGYCLAFNVYIGNKGCVADDIWFGIEGSNGSYVRQPIQTPPLVCGQLLSFNSFSEKPTLSYLSFPTLIRPLAVPLPHVLTPLCCHSTLTHFSTLRLARTPHTPPRSHKKKHDSRL